MATKWVPVLFKHTGELSYTEKSPVGAYVPGAVDLTETAACILSHDDWRHASVAKYEVREVELPDWLAADEWAANFTAWRYTLNAGLAPEWSEAWVRGLAALPTDERLVAVTLLKTKTFRSAFRKAMRDHLVAWLETPADGRKYASPWSPRMRDCLVGERERIAAKRYGEGLYRDRGALGVASRPYAAVATAA